MNARLATITTIALIAIIVAFIPNSFGDSNVALVQSNSNGQQSNAQATCTYGSSIGSGHTLVVSFDAVFINNPVTSIQDTKGDTFTSIGFALNSASTWVRVWQAWSISSGADVVTINYTSSGNGSYQISCDEFLGQLNFTNVGGQGAAQNNCNTCNLNLTATTHAINLLIGWSDSTTATPTGFSYVQMGSFVAKSGSGTCQNIAGGSACILMLHAESDAKVGISGSGVGGSAVVVTCSPACSQNPNFEMAFYANNSVTTVTDTITGWLFPNFAGTGNSSNNTSWILFMFVILLPVGIMDGALLTQTNVDRNAIIFVTLLGLTIGSIMGTMMNFVPFAIPFVFGAVFVIYMWKGRG